jgi:hypothetical protein
VRSCFADVTASSGATAAVVLVAAGIRFATVVEFSIAVRISGFTTHDLALTATTAGHGHVILAHLGRAIFAGAPLGLQTATATLSTGLGIDLAARSVGIVAIRPARVAILNHAGPRIITNVTHGRAVSDETGCAASATVFNCVQIIRAFSISVAVAFAGTA